LSFYIFGLSS